MTVVFFAFTLLFFSRAEGAKKCYVCEGDCKDVKEETCEIKSFMCQSFSYNINGQTVYSRHCVPNTEEEEKTCKKLTEMGQPCYNCHQDLCNSQSERDSETSDESNVQKCYGCEGECEDPDEETCEIEDFVCQAALVLMNGKTIYKRNCLPNTEREKTVCTKIAELSENGNCYTCDEDLCNNKSLSKNTIDGNAIVTETSSAQAKTYSAPVMLLAILVSLFLIKLSTM